MGMLFCDGWELEFSQNNSGLWDTFSQSYYRADMDYVSGSRNGRGIRFTTWNNRVNYIDKALESSYDTLYGQISVKFGAEIPGAVNTWTPLLRFLDEASSTHVDLSIGKTGDVGFSRSTTTTLADSTYRFKPDRWYLLRWKVIIDDSAGELYLDVDGQVVIDESSLDTRNGATDIKTLRLGVAYPDLSDKYVYYDDLVLRDDALPAFVTIYPLWPEADGTYTAWSLSAGTAAWALIDDATGGTADYIYAGTGDVNSVTSCDLDNPLPANIGTIEAIQVNALWSISDAGGTAPAQSMIRSGTIDSYGGSIEPALAEAWYYDVWDLDPDGSAAWTSSALGALEAGARRL